MSQLVSKVPVLANRGDSLDDFKKKSSDVHGSGNALFLRYRVLKVKNGIFLFDYKNELLAEARPKFQTFLKYAKVELTPPTPADIPQIRAGIGRLISAAKNGNWKNTTVKEGVVNTCIAIEVWCWFYVGEVIGKRHIVGYDV